MRKFAFVWAVALGLLSTAVSRADFKIDFSATAGSAVYFDGAGHFTFQNLYGGISTPITDILRVTVAKDNGIVVPSLTNDKATITVGDVFSGGYNPIFTMLNILGTTGDVLTPVGTRFDLYDGAGFYFTADLNFNHISQNESSVGLSSIGIASLSNFGYGGSNPYFQDLASYTGGPLTVSIQFAEEHTLSDLASHPIDSSYSASLKAVPVPPSCIMMLIGGFLTGGAGLFRRRLRAAA